jgi:hypothetical protein
MNNDNTTKAHSTSSQSDPSSPPFLGGPPQAQLDALLDLAQEHAEDALREDGALFPSLFAASPQGLFLLGGRPLKEALEKKEFATDARLICTAQAATAVVVAMETWVLEARPGERLPPGLRPSESPRRKECIVLSGEAVGGFHKQYLAAILRDGCGHFSGLGPAIVPPPEPPEGPLARLLPEAPPTPEVRAFASSVLKARSVNLVEASTRRALRPQENQTKHKS